MSILTKTNTQPVVQRVPAPAKVILGFVLIYGTLEGMARLLGDVLPTENALPITGAVLVAGWWWKSGCSTKVSKGRCLPWVSGGQVGGRWGWRS